MPFCFLYIQYAHMFTKQSFPTHHRIDSCTLADLQYCTAIDTNLFLGIRLQARSLFITHYFFKVSICFLKGRLCGLVVRVPGYRSRGPGSIFGVMSKKDRNLHNQRCDDVKSYLSIFVLLSVNVTHSLLKFY
jgi:hypothetical protein